MRNNHRVGYITRQGLRNEILHERVFPMGVAVKTVVPKPCYDTTIFKIRINTTIYKYLSIFSSDFEVKQH